MGASIVWGLGAVSMAMVAGSFVASGLCGSIKQKQRSAKTTSMDMRSWVLSRLKIGFKPLLLVSERLLRIDKLRNSIASTVGTLSLLGVETNEAAFLSMVLALSIVCGLLGWVLTRSFVFGCAIAAIAVIAVFAAIKSKGDKQNAEMREEVPEALRCMGACFRSGQSLLQTLHHTAAEVGGPLGKLFNVAAERLDMGEPTSEALSVLKHDRNVPELSFIAVALDVQHQSGGSIAAVLESARDSVESELELMRTLRVQTAQAKLSASIVTIMPFILIALFSLMSPDFLSPFFSSLLGMVLLGVALTMQVAGVLMIRHMLKIDVR